MVSTGHDGLERPDLTLMESVELRKRTNRSLPTPCSSTSPAAMPGPEPELVAHVGAEGVLVRELARDLLRELRLEAAALPAAGELAQPGHRALPQGFPFAL